MAEGISTHGVDGVPIDQLIFRLFYMAQDGPVEEMFRRGDRAWKDSKHKENDGDLFIWFLLIIFFLSLLYAVIKYWKT